jgi:hypothetical protein
LASWRLGVLLPIIHGRIEVRETHSLVEVAPAVAEEAVKRLGGVSIRGRRVTARVDRAM